MRKLYLLLAWLSLSATIYSQSLVAYYPFNGNANDQSGNNRNPSVVSAGATLSTDRFGQSNQAYFFNGTNGYMKFNAEGLPAGDRTISIWFNVPEVINRPGFLGYGGNGTCGTSYFMGINLLGFPTYHLQGHCRANEIQYAYSTPPLNTWTHWVATVQGNTFRIYINGVLKATSSTFSTTTAVAGKDLAIGCITSLSGLAPYTDVNINYTKGKLDDIRIYDAALSEAQVQQLYQQEANGLVAWYPFNGNANDESDNGNNGTVNGATLTTDRFGNANKAYNFTNPNHILVSNSNLLGDEFTVSYWFKINSYFGYRAVMSNVAFPNGGFQQQFDGISFSYTLGYSFIGGYSPNYFYANYTMQEPVNQWHHLAVTYKKLGDYSSETKLYINGDLKKTDVHVVPINYTPNAPFYIGQNHDGLNFQGDLDDIRIYKRVLAEQEIKSSYYAQVTDLVAYYPFNGNANDESIIANHAAVNGATLVNDRNGAPDQAYSFNGTTRLQAPAQSIHDFGTGDFSITSWVNLSVITTSRIISAGTNVNDSIWGLGFGNHSVWGSGVRINYFVYSGDAFRDFNSDEITGYEPGQWAHVGVSKSGSNLTFYYNGRQVGSATINYPSNSNSLLSIGCRQSVAGTFIEYMNGKLDEVRIYNRALTATEMQLMANNGLGAYYAFNGNARDSSGNNNHGTITGAISIPDRFLRSGKAYQFNGSSDVITVPDHVSIRAEKEITLAAWVKRTRMGIDMILEKGGDWTEASCNYGLSLHNINNNMFYFFFKGGWRGTAGVNDYEWHHYAVVAKNGESDPQLFIDGELKPVSYRSGSATILLEPSASELHIGAQTGAYPYYSANQIDEVYIYQRMLSISEVKRLAGNGLIAYYPFNGNADDESGYNHNGSITQAVLTTDRFTASGNAYLFDGVNDKITATEHPDWNFGNGDFTITSWVNLNAVTVARIVSAGYDANDGIWALGFGTNPVWGSGLRINWYVKSGGANRDFNSSEITNYTLGQWAFIGVTKCGSQLTFYFNGQAAGTATIMYPSNANSYLIIGARQYTNPGDLWEWFNGKIDEVRIYNRALSPNEILQLADVPLVPELLAYLPMNGNARDISGNQRNGTQYGGATPTTDKHGNANSAYFFSGADCGIQLEKTNTLDFVGQPFAISAWVKYSNIIGAPSAIVSKHACGTPNGYVLAIADNIPTFFLAVGGGWSAITAPGTYNDNKWHHLVATYDTSGVQRLFVDGEMVNTAPGQVVYNNPSGSSVPLIIGDAAGSCTSGTFSASIDEVKVYGASLSAAQVSALYKQSRGSGTALLFAGNSTNHVLLTEQLEPPPAISLEAWVLTKGTIGRQWLFAGSSANTWQWGLEGNKMVFASLNGTEVQSATININNSKWHHLAVTFSGSEARFYVDGMPAGSAAISAAGSANGLYAVGNRTGTTESFDGLLDELRIWGTALSPTTLHNWMNRKITPSHPNFDNMGYYFNFDEVSATKTYDLRQGVTAQFIDGGSMLWSGAPVGDTAAYDFTNTVKSAMVPFAANEQLTVTATSGNPNGIVVYLVKDPPVSVAGTSGTGGIDHYYGVQVIGGTSPTYTAVYNYGGSAFVTPLLEPGLALFRRTDNSVQQWNNSNAVLNTTAKTLTVTGENTEYILGTTGFALAVEDRLPGVQPVLVYPNPAQLHVTLKGVEQFSSLQLFDMNGKLILERRNNQQPIIHLNLLGLKSGLYILQLLDRSETKTIKLMIGN